MELTNYLRVYFLIFLFGMNYHFFLDKDIGITMYKVIIIK